MNFREMAKHLVYEYELYSNICFVCNPHTVTSITCYKSQIESLNILILFGSDYKVKKLYNQINPGFETLKCEIVYDILKHSKTF